MFLPLIEPKHYDHMSVSHTHVSLYANRGLSADLYINIQVTANVQRGTQIPKA